MFFQVLVCPTGPGGFGLVLPRPTGLEGVWIFSSTGSPNGSGGFIFFKYWSAQRARGVWLSTASPNGSEKRFDFFQVLVRPTGLGESFSFQVLVCPTGLGDSFLSTGSPNGSGGVLDFSSSTGSPNGSGGVNFFQVLVRPTGLEGFRIRFQVLVCPTGLEGFGFVFKYWFAQRVWFHFFQVLVRPTGLHLG